MCYVLLNGGEIDENDENQAKAETETEDWETVVHYFSSSALGFAGLLLNLHYVSP